MSTGRTTSADRELRAEAVLDVPPAAVWAVLADPRRMPELSPELVRLVALKPGGLRPGQSYLGLNRRGLVCWPTRSVVETVEAERLLVWDTVSSGARWVWELHAEGPSADRTRVVHRRPVPERLTRLGSLFAGALLGGVAGHADELEAGMAVSVQRLKAIVEA